MNKGLYCNIAYRINIGDREEQQDCLGLDKKEDSAMAVVCDGMGGLNNGAAASATAVRKLIDLYGANESDDIPLFFLESVDILDESVYRISEKERSSARTGTTIVSAFINNDGLYWMSVGDSRLYIIRNGAIVAATRDHNYNLLLEEMRKSNIETKDEDKGEALVSFIGMGGIELMDISREPFVLKKDDRILLTSDGLYKLLSDEQIKDIVIKNGSVEEVASELLAEALNQPVENKDNISFILINMEEKV